MLVTECRCKELCTSVGLVTCGETAGEHYHLCFAYLSCKLCCRIPYILCIAVAEYSNHRLGTGSFKSSCRIIFAVAAGENRYEYPGLRNLVPAYINAVILLIAAFNSFTLCLSGDVGEYLIKSLNPCIKGIFCIYLYITVDQIAVSYASDLPDKGVQFMILYSGKIFFAHLKDDIAYPACKQIISCNII